jgi:hypothetical protein
MPPAVPAGALNPEEVQVGTANGPGLYLAPAGTEAPDLGDDFTSPWVILGYLSDDGPTVGNSVDSEDLIPWQSIVPIRSVPTGRTITMQFVLWQLNEHTLALYFDADVPEPDADGGIDMELRTDTPQHIYAVAIDSADAERLFRLSFTRASLTDAGDMAITRGAAVPLDVTLAALDDGGLLGRVQLGAPAEGNGNGNGARKAAAASAAA